MRQRDHAVRLGGEEFMLFLPATGAHEAEVLVERLRAEWAREHDTTFSAGIAGWPQDGQDLSALLAAADRRQQACKRLGGNRVMARDP